jgi:hypothetical protein
MESLKTTRPLVLVIYLIHNLPNIPPPFLHAFYNSAKSVTIISVVWLEHDLCKDPAMPPTQAANKKRQQKIENENSAFNSYLLICVGIGAVLVQLGLVESRKK